MPLLGKPNKSRFNSLGQRMAARFKLFPSILCVVIIIILISFSSAAELSQSYEKYSLETSDNVAWSELRFKRQTENQLSPTANSKPNKALDSGLSDNSSQIKVATSTETSKTNLSSLITSNNNNNNNSVSVSTPNVNDVTTTNSTTTTTTPVLDEEDAPAPTVDYNGRRVNTTSTAYDHHRYYNSTFYSENDKAKELWVDLDKLPPNQVIVHDMLSQSHRRAATVALSFEFPFYGHLVRNVTIATGGFLYLGDYMHSWLAATQYIAPLMANFDTSLSNDSTIKYVDNGSSFVVQWERVVLQDRKDAGNFTFQAVLYNTGDITFVYKEIPLLVSSIRDEAHPVKVGISDAYIIDRTIFFVRRKTIYEYHKIDLKRDEIRNWTAIYFSALPTCLSFRDCDACLNNTINFACTWCPTAGRCSDGMDRSRQDWLFKNCDKTILDDAASCTDLATSSPSTGLVTSNPTPALVPGATSSSSTSAAAVLPSTGQGVPEDVQTAKSVDVVVSTASTATMTTNTPLVDVQRTTPANPALSTSFINPSQQTKETQTGEVNASGIIGLLIFAAIIVACGGWAFYAYRNPQTPSGQLLIKYRPSNWSWRRGQVHYTAASIHM